MKKCITILMIFIILFSGCSKDKIFKISKESKDIVSTEGGEAVSEGGYLLFARSGSQSGMGIVDAETGEIQNIYKGNYQRSGVVGDRLFYNVTDKERGGVYCFDIKLNKFSLITKEYTFKSLPVGTEDGSTAAFIGYSKTSYNPAIYYMDAKKCIPQRIEMKNESIRDLSFGKNKELLYSRKLKDKDMTKIAYQIFKYSFADMKESRLRVSSDNEVDPILSPDGKKLAFVSDKYVDYNLFVMDLQSGAVNIIGMNDAIVGGTVKWSKDSRYLCYVRLKGAASYSVKTADVERKVTYDIGEGYNICFSPNGKEVAYASYDPKEKKQVVFIKGIKGGKSRMLFEYPEESRYSRSIDTLQWLK